MDNTIKRPVGEKVFLVISSIILTGFAAICIYPILLVIGSSFTDEMSILRTGYTIIPPKISLTAYKLILAGNSAMLRAYVVSARSRFWGQREPWRRGL